MSVGAEPQARAGEPQPAAIGIQPTGFLLGLSSDWRVDCASANLSEFTGLEAADVLGRPIADLLTGEAVHLIRNRVALLRDEESPERLIDHQLTPGGEAFDACLRQSEGAIVLEAVPGTDPGGIDVAGTVERMLRRIEAQPDVAALAVAATRELRALTGFDGIQIYRNDDKAPECIASFVRSGLSEFEPAVGADALQHPLFVADLNQQPVPILCANGARAKSRPALLATAAPGLAEAVRRTGARSAALLPVSGSRGPWGFALALHRHARTPRLARQSAAELFAHIAAVRIEAMEAEAASR